MNISKTLIAASASALVAVVAFLPGTAEAHCGGHDDSCQPEDYFWGTFCRDGHLFNDYTHYSGYCGAPSAGCSGAGCLNWPCAQGACEAGSQHGCYQYGWEQDLGGTSECALAVGCGNPCDVDGATCNGGYSNGQCWGGICSCG